MKKWIKSSVFTLLAVVTLTTSRPSQAAVGLIVANPAIVAAGLVTVKVGGAVLAGTAVYGVVTKDSGETKVAKLTLGILGGIALGVIGFGLMDNEQAFAYSTVSADEASQLGLTSGEVESYNAEIDQVNALAGHVDSELAKLSEPTLEDSVAVWTSVQDAVSTETFSAMQKVTAQLYK